MQFHHLGVPVTEPKDNETHLEDVGVYITDSDSNPYKIEWLRFEAHSPMPKEIQENVHAAFTVDNLEEALAGQEVILDPVSPMEGLRIAFVLHEGTPVELMEFSQ